MSYLLSDKLCLLAQESLKTLFGPLPPQERPLPTQHVRDTEPLPLSEEQRRLAASLMRINHTGEVCAQALYQGHALTARNPNIAQRMSHAAQEEYDHMHWCANRLQTLNSHTSRLNPLWYLGALSIGTIAGLFGDRWNLGFVVETERQVVTHLQDQLQRLPENDVQSRAIVEQMAKDEAEHAVMAEAAGATSLPLPICTAMKAMAHVMKAVAAKV